VCYRERSGDDTPHILVDNVTLLDRFVQTAITLFSHAIPIALYQHCLAFFAAVVRIFGGSPFFVNLVCHFSYRWPQWKFRIGFSNADFFFT
jgi:hypothetical protein